MRGKFPGYYRPSATDCEEQFKKCLFSFDTNTLLNLYRYTPASRDSFLNVLRTKIKDRIWLPYQVASEYHENRIEVITEQTALFGKLADTIDNAIKSIQQHRRSASFLSTELMEFVKTALETIKADLEKKKSEHPDLLDNDMILTALTDLFDDSKVGEPYSEDELKKLQAKIKTRFDNEIPPGFLDSTGKKKKEGDRQYGDGVVWFQLIDHAKQDKDKRPIILVTDETGKDWWELSHGKTIGPRCELVQEMHEVGVWFYMYSPNRFLEFSNKYLNADVKPDVIKEVKKLRNERKELHKLDSLEGAFTPFLPGLAEAFTPLFEHANRQQEFVGALSQAFYPLFEEARRRQEVFAGLAQALTPLTLFEEANRQQKATAIDTKLEKDD